METALSKELLSDSNLSNILGLHNIATQRGQSLAQMALAGFKR
jgi:hypothetical protein